MHDGSIAALGEVLDHYVAGGRAPNPRQSESIQPLTLREDERRDLIAFLPSLTDEALLHDPRRSDPWSAPQPFRKRRLWPQGVSGTPSGSGRSSSNRLACVVRRSTSTGRHVLSRVLAAVVCGYAAANAVAVGLAQILPMSRGDAVMTGIRDGVAAGLAAIHRGAAEAVELADVEQAVIPLRRTQPAVLQLDQASGLPGFLDRMACKAFIISGL